MCMADTSTLCSGSCRLCRPAHVSIATRPTAAILRASSSVLALQPLPSRSIPPAGALARGLQPHPLLPGTFEQPGRSHPTLGLLSRLRHAHTDRMTLVLHLIGCIWCLLERCRFHKSVDVPAPLPFNILGNARDLVLEGRVRSVHRDRAALLPCNRIATPQCARVSSYNLHKLKFSYSGRSIVMVP